MHSPHYGKWEKRWHPLREEWVVYSAHRNNRPWSFDLKKHQPEKPAYDPACYLCPGNLRSPAHSMPNGWPRICTLARHNPFSRFGIGQYANPWSRNTELSLISSGRTSSSISAQLAPGAGFNELD